jgi:hypothetical protein
MFVLNAHIAVGNIFEYHFGKIRITELSPLMDIIGHAEYINDRSFTHITYGSLRYLHDDLGYYYISHEGEIVRIDEITPSYTTKVFDMFQVSIEDVSDVNKYPEIVFQFMAGPAEVTIVAELNEKNIARDKTHATVNIGKHSIRLPNDTADELLSWISSFKFTF